MNQDPSQTGQVACDDTDIQSGVRISSGIASRITVEVPRGALACFLLDEDMIDVLPFYPYEIHDANGRILEGETDESGYFYHADLPADHYIPKVNDIDYVIPTLQEEDEPYHIRVLGEHAPESDELIRVLSEEEW